MTDPDAIAKRAYELFLDRGSEPGHEVDDWLRAEAEINARAAAAALAEEPLSAGMDYETDQAGSASDPGRAGERAPGDRDRPSGKRSNGSRRTVRPQDTR